MFHLKFDRNKGVIVEHAPLSCYWARGTSFVNGHKVQGYDLVKYLVSSKDRKDLIRRLNCLNGFYAVSFMHGSTLYAAVDRVRSIPLFYSASRCELLVSNDPFWILGRLGQAEFNSLSVAEFLLTGYVTGPFTLDSRIRQLQAGEMLLSKCDSCGISIEVIRYYEFSHGEYFSEPARSLMKILDELTLEAVNRVVEYADGRPIVIPLSGGLDSRLIALSLKRLGYKNVIAFSYGREGNLESAVSRSVANQLGIRWHFVEYTEENWINWYKSEEYRTYVRFAEGLTSVAHIQDWPAVRVLRQRGALPDNAVIVPGHSADFVAGSHIQFNPMKIVGPNLKLVVREIWRYHYSLNDPRLAANYSGLVDEREVVSSLCSKIEALLVGRSAADPSEAVDAYEFWDWQERQAKFIVNSVRVYDFWGQDWWLPWWDARFIGFWQHIPLCYRWGKKLYDEYVHQVQEKMRVHVSGGGVSGSKRLLKRVVAGAKLSVLIEVYSSIRRWYRHRIAWHREVRNHPLCWYGLIEPSQYAVLRRPGTNINSFLAVDQIRHRCNRG